MSLCTFFSEVIYGKDGLAIIKIDGGGGREKHTSRSDLSYSAMSKSFYQ